MAISSLRLLSKILGEISLKMINRKPIFGVAISSLRLLSKILG